MGMNINITNTGIVEFDSTNAAKVSYSAFICWASLGIGPVIIGAGPVQVFKGGFAEIESIAGVAPTSDEDAYDRLKALYAGAMSAGGDHDLDVARGLVAGQSWRRVFGSFDSISSSAVFDDITAAGGIYPWPTVLGRFRLITTGSDSAAGAGAQSVGLTILDENWDEQTILLATNGGTSDWSTLPGYRLNNARVKGVGTYGGSNENTITIQHESSPGVGTLLDIIAAGSGLMNSTAYTVPNGFTAYVMQTRFTIGVSKSADVQLRARLNADIFVAPFGPSVIFITEEDLAGSPAPSPYMASDNAPSKTDVIASAKLHVSGGSTSADIEYWLKLVKD